MEGPGRRWRRVALAGVVAAALALTVPSIASGYLVTGSASFPPPDNCVAPLLPCYIILSIHSGSHGNKETVTGAQFWPGEPLTVYFWNGTPGGSTQIVASGFTGTGSFAVSFHIPQDPVGNYTVFVTDLVGDNQSAPFHLTHLSANPDSGPVANTTSLSGQGFLPDHVVKFHLHGVRAPTAVPCETNRFGNFSDCRVTIPNVPTGRALLVATDGTNIARIEFVVS